MTTGGSSLWIVDYESNVPYKYDFLHSTFKQQGHIKAMNIAVGLQVIARDWDGNRLHIFDKGWESLNGLRI